MTFRRDRILFVIGSLATGGSESQLAILAQALAGNGWRVDVFALQKAGAFVEPLEAAGVRVIDGGYRKPGNTSLFSLTTLALAAPRLLFHILRFRPGVLHAFLPLTNFIGAVCGRIGLVPVVVTSKRGLGTHQDRHPWLGWLDRVANRLSTVVVANAEAVAADVAQRDGYDARQIIVIPNGLDFDRFDRAGDDRQAARAELGLAGDDVALCVVANLIPYKGHADLVDALGLLAPDHPRLQLFAIGEDRGAGAGLARRAGDLGISDRIRFLGRRHDVPRLLSAMDVGVLPSHEEGLANALIEKLAAGLPIVATDVGGNREIIERLPDCRLVPPRDSAELARALAAAAEDVEASRGRASRRAESVRRRFSIAAMVAAYESLYRSLS